MTNERLPVGKIEILKPGLKIRGGDEKEFHPVEPGTELEFTQALELSLAGALLRVAASNTGNCIQVLCRDTTIGLLDPRQKSLPERTWRREIGPPGYVAEEFGNGDPPAAKVTFLGHEDRATVAKIIKLVNGAVPGFSHRLNLPLDPDRDGLARLVIWSTPIMETIFENIDNPFAYKTEVPPYRGWGMVVGEIGVDPKLTDLIKFRLMAITRSDDDGLFRVEKGNWVTVLTAKGGREHIIKKFAQLSVFFRNLGKEHYLDYLKDGKFSLSLIHNLTTSLEMKSEPDSIKQTLGKHLAAINADNVFTWGKIATGLGPKSVREEIGMIESQISFAKGLAVKRQKDA